MTDGTMVIIEGVKKAKYHVVCRHLSDIEYSTEEEKYYPKEYKYKELIDLCLSIEKFSELNCNAYRKEIQNRQIKLIKKMGVTNSR